ncbi:ADP-ribose pyrophosphatase [Xenococcus sp. PCC 7305]|uniref:NUDIX hydrolase n=1 Tax=Xenococcus sp. PCC 7305 TaxID=102125 RepID=UPI0002ACB547|nr:NUDIX domain-containing protein [Xenococcus sp. PCC 7305]ELS01304.1 ADP-ribose pyrophosphatase [Xenococcus sp. PCC 7305]
MVRNPPVAAMAILYQDNKFLMQLRDDIEGILYPGQWGFFGGHLDPGENPEVGVKRELIEEINYVIEKPKFYKCYADHKAERYIFYSPLTVDINELELNEGWDLDLVPVENIQHGFHYSDKPNMERPLGDIHRQILLDFMSSHNV